jgi:hypothetical protein
MLQTKAELRRHVFREHPEIDVKASYAMTVENYVGPREMYR